MQILLNLSSFLLVLFRHMAYGKCYHKIPKKICYIFDRSYYRVDMKKMVRNLFIYHSIQFKFNDFLQNDAVVFLIIDIFPIVQPIK